MDMGGMRRGAERRMDRNGREYGGGKWRVGKIS